MAQSRPFDFFGFSSLVHVCKVQRVTFFSKSFATDDEVKAKPGKPTESAATAATAAVMEAPLPKADRAFSESQPKLNMSCKSTYLSPTPPHAQAPRPTPHAAPRHSIFSPPSLLALWPLVTALLPSRSARRRRRRRPWC